MLPGQPLHEQRELVSHHQQLRGWVADASRVEEGYLLPWPGPCNDRPPPQRKEGRFQHHCKAAAQDVPRTGELQTIQKPGRHSSPTASFSVPRHGGNAGATT